LTPRIASSATFAMKAAVKVLAPPSTISYSPCGLGAKLRLLSKLRGHSTDLLVSRLVNELPIDKFMEHARH
jgi:hypothetical protein